MTGEWVNTMLENEAIRSRGWLQNQGAIIMKPISGKHRCVTVVVLAGVLALGFWLYPTTVRSQNPAAPSALVGALQGEAEVFWEGQQEEKKLKAGETVQPWNTITTDQNTRLLLQWSNGLVTSSG